MLVLSRRLGQRFQIGDDVRITIVKVDRNSVRIGIEAPADVTVRREEILDEIEDETQMSAQRFKADAA
jgi:carbon storage regulator